TKEFLAEAQQWTSYDERGNIGIENQVTIGYAQEKAGQAHHWFREVQGRQWGCRAYNPDNRQVPWKSPQRHTARTSLTEFEQQQPHHLRKRDGCLHQRRCRAA